MPESVAATEGAPTPAPRSLFSDTRAAASLVLGAVVLLLWVGLIVGSFAGLGEDGCRLLSDVLLGAMVATAVVTLLTRLSYGIVATVAAVLFAGAWWYIGWSLTYAIADVLYYGMIAGFYLTPPVVGLAAILASRARSAALR